MYAFLLIILVLDGIFLGVIVLLQSGKGGGLAAMGGGGGPTSFVRSIFGTMKYPIPRFALEIRN